MAEVLQLVKGATFGEPLTVHDRDGTPTDLTDASLRWLAKRRIDDEDEEAVLEATSPGSTIIVVDAEAGSLRFAIPAADTDALTAGVRYVWTLQVVKGGVVTRYPDGFQRGPGLLLVTASAITTVPT